MADYHPLILRAVEGLDKNTGENRRALYERARTALVAQLRGVVPPLDESEITRERLALEEAIRKVEAESARRAREEPRKPPPLRPAATPRREEFRREEPARAAPPPPPPPPQQDPWADLAQAGSPETRDAPRERPAEHSSLTDEAVRGFRDAMSDPLAEPPPRSARHSQPHSYDQQPAPQRPPTPQDFDRQDTRHETRHERESSYEHGGRSSRNSRTINGRRRHPRSRRRRLNFPNRSRRRLPRGRAGSSRRNRGCHVRRGLMPGSSSPRPSFCCVSGSAHWHGGSATPSAARPATSSHW